MGLALYSESGNEDLSSVMSTEKQSQTAGAAPDTPQFLKEDYSSESRLVGLFQNQQPAQAEVTPTYSLLLIVVVGLALIYFIGG
jgi:hypothetical protein